MFDYAIGHYQTHPPTRRMLASWAISLLSHAAAALILYQYPELLHDPVRIWIRIPLARPAQVQETRWRPLATLSTRMEMPPIEEIKKNLYDWGRARTDEGTHRPIRINIPKAILDDVSAPAPKPQPAAPAQPPAGVPTPGTGTTPTNAAPGVPRTEPTVAPRAVSAPPPPDTAPPQIPKGVTPPASATANQAASSGSGNTPPGVTPSAAKKDARDSGQQIRAQGPVFFDDKGFNLEEYANLVRERVKENWFIPSNLRNYAGSTTIIFYIGKDGQVTGARIDVPSGNDSLNLSALSAVFGSNPFPPLPKGFPADRVGARLVFAYNERQ